MEIILLLYDCLDFLKCHGTWKCNKIFIGATCYKKSLPINSVTTVGYTKMK